MVSKLMNVLQYGRQCVRSVLPCRQLSAKADLKVQSNAKPKTGIIMLNMGGPSSIAEVPEYLLRIMTDRDMIQLPFQSKLGPLIAQSRAPKVQKKYEEIGGKSPILDWTNKQGELLCEQLDKVSPETAPHKHYVAFRYAKPLTSNTLENMEKDGVERTVLFSQYPQYCCATSGSSFIEIYKYYKNRQLPSNMKWSVIDRWATHPLLIETIADRIKEQLVQFPEDIRNDVIILFSAHSLPLQAVSRGDAYASEVASTVSLVMEKLRNCNPYKLVWQSKVGPVAWLEPFTDEAIKAYVKQGKKHFILVPVAFVNEHIETLHELDIEYCKELAEELGIDTIRRAAAPNDHPKFIEALTDIVLSHLKSERPISPMFLTRCPHCESNNCVESKNWYAQICKN
ncbi:ferrochelatase, mitochondrial [Ceratina calcarata]|uniref:Ferrochelatase n=1 Tax=Ceratina calcarata TaxID=156304 RepID=A0AAJ7N5P2_9HYME|nr:ferrochelatase, mitochondrial [Ceratina calcarata]